MDTKKTTLHKAQHEIASLASTVTEIDEQVKTWESTMEVVLSKLHAPQKGKINRLQPILPAQNGHIGHEGLDEGQHVEKASVFCVVWSNGDQKGRYWGPDEHKRFLQAIAFLHPPDDYASIAQYVGTRNIRQVRSHTSKYAERVARYPMKCGSGKWTKQDICSLWSAIYLIRQDEGNISTIFEKVSKRFEFKRKPDELKEKYEQLLHDVMSKDTLSRRREYIKKGKRKHNTTGTKSAAKRVKSTTVVTTTQTELTDTNKDDSLDYLSPDEELSADESCFMTGLEETMWPVSPPKEPTYEQTLISSDGRLDEVSVASLCKLYRSSYANEEEMGADLKFLESITTTPEKLQEDSDIPITSPLYQ